MRTTVEFDPDTARAVQELRREKGRGVSEAVNELIRRGMLAEPRPQPFVARSQKLGIKVDVSNITDALDLLEGPDAR
jgi:Ribbon-helix-helix protein, copG family